MRSRSSTSAAINHAQATGGDTERMAAAETADCVGCAQNRKAIEDFYGPNAKVDGGDWVMGRYATKAGPAGSWLVALAVTYGPQTVDRPGTQNDEELKPGRLRVKFKLVWSDGSWKVAENTRIAPPPSGLSTGSGSGVATLLAG